MKLKYFNSLCLTQSVAALLLFSCGSESVKVVAPSTPLLIETKAQVRNSKESNNVKIDIALSPNKVIRLEITALMGYRVASVLMTPQKIQYAIHTNQTFGEGPFSARTMFPIFKRNIDPRIIWRVINSQNPQSAELSCQVDENQRPTACAGTNGFTVKWTYEDPLHKKIEIKSGDFEMNWIFKDQRVLRESQTETFVLKKPEGYREIVQK